LGGQEKGSCSCPQHGNTGRDQATDGQAVKECRRRTVAHCHCEHVVAG